MRNVSNKAIAGAAIVAGVLTALQSGAFAANAAITGAFTSTQTDMVTYATAGIAMVLAVFALGVGLRVLIKFGRRAAGAA
jgi:hypothetical protein